jgi:hypothetical protein
LHADDELIAQLAQHPGWKVLEKRFHDKREAYFTRLGKELHSGNMQVDQRVIDEKRGFWFGGLWFLLEAKRATKAFEREYNPARSDSTD